MSDYEGILQTVEDFEAAYGQGWGRLAMGDNGIRKARGMGLAKAEMTTGTAGTYQYLVGAKLWAQMNTEQNIFGAIPKEEWNYSGIRVVHGMPQKKLIGAAEGNSTLAATELPSFAQYNPTIKLVYRNFDATMQQMFLASKGEGVTWEQYRDFMGVTFGKGINEMLLRPVEDINKNAGGDNFTNQTVSLDQIATSNSEVTGCGITAGNEDIYGIDRSVSTWAEGTSMHNGSAGTETDRSLSLTLLNDAWRTLNLVSGDYSMDSYYWVTGADTYQRWGELLQPQQRFDQSEASFSPVNGVKVGMDPSHKVKFRVGTYEGAPIIVSQDVPKDTLSRVYLVHKDYTRLRVVQPIVYREIGVTTGQELLTQRFSDIGMWYMAGELVSYFPKGSLLKLRGLK